MNSFEKLKLRMSTSGENIREEKINDSRRMLQIENENDVSYCDTLYFWNSDNKLNARVFNRKYNSSYGNVMGFQSLIEEPIIAGNIITNVSDNSHWICVESYTDEIRYFGLLAQATYIFKFQHPTTGTILSYPCITSKILSSGEKQTDVMTLPNGSKKVILPYDENTILLQNTQGKTLRFFLDNHPTNPKPYKLTFADTTSKIGLVELYLTEDDLQNNDRIDLGVCDYFTPISPTPDPFPTPTPTGYTLTISSSGEFLIGTTRTLTPILKDGDGNIISSWIAVWTIDYNGMNPNLFDITYIGNQCRIKIRDDAYDIVDEVLPITCKTSDGLVVATYNATIIA